MAKAEEDYTLVLICLRRKTPLTYSATFHAQQCAEKYLKALLVQQGHSPPKIHDLEVLKILCLKFAIIVPIEDDKLALLTDYAVQARYPGDNPTPDEARAAFEIAKSVRKFAKGLL